ncbi:MAG: mercuric reductase [Gemmatimonadaceae bacterium]|nr:mercuric reductase [Gemmatimonadaceae bacterium]
MPTITPGTHYDLAVIGAGQGGGPLAGAFARAGKRVALIERSHVGGTCINEGCTPTKTMIASARVAYVTRRSADYGVHAGDIRIDLRRVGERKQEIVSSFRHGSESALERAGVELVRGNARFVGERRLEVASSDNGREITADLVVVNTGLSPAIPPIEGLDRAPYLTSSSIMELSEVPKHLIVIGGGYVGLEFAQMFRRFGSSVTVLQRENQLLTHEDVDVADEIKTILSDEGIRILLGVEVTGVEAQGSNLRLVYDTRDRSVTGSVTGSHLLVAAGRVPNTNDLQLAAAGVETDARGFIRVNERLETTAPGVFAIGDVNGGPAFTHVSYDDFRILRTNLLGAGGATTTGRLVPYTVFLDPQLGRIGMTEREASAAGKRIKIAKLPMTSVARALEVDETRGFMKAIVDAESGRLLGAAVLGIEGGEIAGLLQIAMIGNLHYGVLRDGIFSHPTLAESLNNLFAAMDRSG